MVLNDQSTGSQGTLERLQQPLKADTSFFNLGSAITSTQHPRTLKVTGDVIQGAAPATKISSPQAARADLHSRHR